MTPEERLVHLRAGLKYHEAEFTKWVKRYELFGLHPEDKRLCNYHHRQVKWFERTIRRIEKGVN